MNKAIMYGGPADGLERDLMGAPTPISIPYYYDGSVLYYMPKFTDAGKLAVDSEGRVIYRYGGYNFPPEKVNVP